MDHFSLKVSISRLQGEFYDLKNIVVVVNEHSIARM